MSLSRVFCALTLVVCAALPAAAQTAPVPPAGKLQVTVADPSGAVIPGATVTIAGQDDATRAAAVEPGLTTAAGLAEFLGLRPGRYTITAAFDAFETEIGRAHV